MINGLLMTAKPMTFSMTLNDSPSDLSYRPLAPSPFPFSPSPFPTFTNTILFHFQHLMTTALCESDRKTV